MAWATRPPAGPLGGAGGHPSGAPWMARSEALVMTPKGRMPAGWRDGVGDAAAGGAPRGCRRPPERSAMDGAERGIGYDAEGQDARRLAGWRGRRGRRRGPSGVPAATRAERHGWRGARHWL